MAHAQKPDFVFRRNGRVHLNRRGRQFSRLLAAEVCAISGSNAGYTMLRGSVKGTGYPLHPPVSPSLPLPCVTVWHHISTGLHYAHRSFATTVSQLKICDSSGETFIKVLKCYNFPWVQRRHNCSPAASFANCVMTPYLLKVHLINVYFYTNNSKIPNFELWHSCRKWAIWFCNKRVAVPTCEN